MTIITDGGRSVAAGFKARGQGPEMAGGVVRRRGGNGVFKPGIGSFPVMRHSGAVDPALDDAGTGQIVGLNKTAGHGRKHASGINDIAQGVQSRIIASPAVHKLRQGSHGPCVGQAHAVAEHLLERAAVRTVHGGQAVAAQKRREILSSIFLPPGFPDPGTSRLIRPPLGLRDGA